ncbi:MAG TPA: hypothetical protein VHG32_02465 [Thermoanaerobaculia bacterium]|jgi:hypothetical protein|nr:hypothetical protein [Thermoanaerobaculia bacterium]
MEDPVSRLAVFVRSIAETTEVREDDLARLGAHLFAAASLLHDRYWEASWEEMRWTAHNNLDAALLALRSSGASGDPSILYGRYMDALLRIEDWLTGDSEILRSQLRSEVRSIVLEGSPGMDFELIGTVSVWLHAPSLARQVERKAEQGVADDARHPPKRPSPPGALLNSLGLYWRVADLPRLIPIPCTEVMRVFDDPWEDSGFPLKVALCPLIADSGPRFDIDPEGREFAACRPEGMRESGQLEDHLRRVFFHAIGAGVHLLVFPELCIDTHARQVILEQLAELRNDFLGVMAGSFHVWDDKAETRPANESVFLDASGAVALKHEKSGHFFVTPNQVKQYGHFFREVPADLPFPQITEGIRRGQALHVLDMRWGRICVLICADASDPGCKYREVLWRIRPDFLFVVSLSLETERFEAFSRELKDLAVSTLFVNASCACAEGDELAFVDLAFWYARGGPATQVRWLKSRSLLWRSFEEKGSPWKPVQDGELGVALLGEETGMVIDLGAFYRYWLSVKG